MTESKTEMGNGTEMDLVNRVLGEVVPWILLLWCVAAMGSAFIDNWKVERRKEREHKRLAGQDPGQHLGWTMKTDLLSVIRALAKALESQSGAGCYVNIPIGYLATVDGELRLSEMAEVLLAELRNANA